MSHSKRHFNLIPPLLAAAMAKHSTALGTPDLNLVPAPDLETLLLPEELHRMHGPGRRTKSKLAAINAPLKKKKRKLQKRARRFTRLNRK